MMPELSFGLVVAGVDLTDDDVVNALYDAGVDDVTFAVRDGSHVVYVDREGDTLLDAVAAAVTELEAAHPDLRVVGFEGHELLTQAGVAELTGRTRQSIHQHVRGDRGGSRGFPSPLGWADASRAMWLRSDIARWASDEQSGNAGEADEVVFASFMLGRAIAGSSGFPSSAFSFAATRVIALSEDEEDDVRVRLVHALRETADQLEAT